MSVVCKYKEMGGMSDECGEGWMACVPWYCERPGVGPHTAPGTAQSLLHSPHTLHPSHQPTIFHFKFIGFFKVIVSRD